MGGGKSKGIYAIVPYDWQEQEQLDVPARWHTGDPETDPWEWRMRVLEERDDIAYAKVFFRVSGYITKEWYPYFLAARRGGTDLEELYERGEVSELERRVYLSVKEGCRVPLHELKKLCGISKEESSSFEKAVTDLQMKLMITVCGRARKLNKYGMEYGWSSDVFCTCEEFWGGDITADVSAKEAAEKIREQILKLNPSADEKKIKKFIFG